jgi:excisionase family DNA binding protein
VTVRQAADRLEVSAATVYALLASGKLRHYRIGNGRGVVRISEGHIADYLQKAEPVAKQPPAPARGPRGLKHLHVN